MSSAVVRDARGDALAVSPVFHSNYRLDTSLPAGLRRLTRQIGRIFPRLMNLSVIGLGSPVMDRCAIGFQSALSRPQRAAAFAAMLGGMEASALAQGEDLIAVKDLTDDDCGWADPILIDLGFAKMPSLPVAILDLPFTSGEEYLRSLAASSRRDLRRKLRQQSQVRFEVRTDVNGFEPELLKLYEATRSNGGAGYDSFDALSPTYFRTIVEELDGRALIVLGWVDSVLASFSLMLVAPDCVYAHQIGMRYPLARQHNMYFRNWMFVVRFCLERGIRRLEFGQTSYPVKVRLGCRLERSWVYVKHRVRPVNAVLRRVAPMFGFDRMEVGATG